MRTFLNMYSIDLNSNISLMKYVRNILKYVPYKVKIIYQFMCITQGNIFT